MQFLIVAVLIAVNLYVVDSSPEYEVKTVIVSRFNPADAASVEKLGLMIRSLWVLGGHDPQETMTSVCYDDGYDEAEWSSSATAGNGRDRNSNDKENMEDEGKEGEVLRDLLNTVRDSLLVDLFPSASNMSQWYRATPAWRDLYCSFSIASHLYKLGFFNYNIVFIDPSYAFTSHYLADFTRGAYRQKQQQQQQRRQHIQSNEFHCLSAKSGIDRGVICDLSLFAYKVSFGMSLMAFLNASSFVRSVDVHGQLLYAVDQLGGHIGHFSQSAEAVASSSTSIHVVKAGQYFKSSFSASFLAEKGTSSTTTTTISSTRRIDKASLVEFDNDHHVLTMHTNECYFTVFVRWPHFLTLPIIERSFLPVFTNDTLMKKLSGCVPVDVSGKTSLFQLQVRGRAIAEQQKWGGEELEAKVEISADANTDIAEIGTAKRGLVPSPLPLRIFDCIIFYDEVSLLKLRLALLSELVTAHIIVESSLTFTGKPKPLYFKENIHLFQPYMHKIVYFQIDLPFPKPSVSKEVWNNEYFSRDAIVEALYALPAEIGGPVRDSDVLIVADTDEIPFPEAMRNIRDIFTYANFVHHHHQSGRDRAAAGGGAIDSALFQPPEYYKLYAENYLYNFNCFTENTESNTTGSRALGDDHKSHSHSGVPVDNNAAENDPIQNRNAMRKDKGGAALRGVWGAAVVASVREIKAISADLFASTEAHSPSFWYKPHTPWSLTYSRMYLHETLIVPFQHVLYPGVLHLSFFGGITRIKRKLESYSHQNFARQFDPPKASPVESEALLVDDAAPVLVYTADAEPIALEAAAAIAGSDASSARKVAGNSGVMVDEHSLATRVKNGEVINPVMRSDGMKCMFERPSMGYRGGEVFTRKARDMWAELASDEDILAF